MEWRGRRGSRNVEDRRGTGARAGGMGIVGVLAVLAVGYFFGIDISPIVGALDQGSQSGEPRELTAEEQEMGQFVSVVLADNEEVWHRVLPQQAGVDYREPSAGDVLGYGEFGLRHGAIGDGSLLLPQ